MSSVFVGLAVKTLDPRWVLVALSPRCVLDDGGVGMVLRVNTDNKVMLVGVDEVLK